MSTAGVLSVSYGAQVFKIAVFPGMTFLVNFALFLDWVDRKVYARTQNRVGPPWYQPWVDVAKLCLKEDIMPSAANRVMFTALPIVALTLSGMSFLLLPLGRTSAVYPFSGDLIVVIFLMTLSTITLFLMGWYSGNPYARVGSIRVLSQFLAYEVPMVLSFLTPAMLAGSWSLSNIRAGISENWGAFAPALLPAMLLALVALQGKLERVPFDAPEAETEIVAGPLTEYTGRRLAFVWLARRCELVVGLGLLYDLFFPWHSSYGIIGFMVFGILATAVLSVLRAAFARLRIEDTTVLAWRYFMPLSVAVMAVAILVRG